ncbi:MAG: alpha-L-fucosidase [Isosphaeraceae bacterium]
MTLGRVDLWVFLSIVLGLTLGGATHAADPPEAGADSRARARAEFQDRRFGLFVHWGVYSLLGKGEWVMENEKLSVSEYEKLPPRFQPSGFNADAWARAAKAAGVKYVTVTAKHHDGFCMFESASTSYDVVDATPYAKDPLKALAEACRQQGLTLFFYYSLLDWHHPDYFPLGRTGRHAGRAPGGDWSRYVAYYRGQVRELCTRYGPIGGIWFDGAWDRPNADWGLAETYRMIHELQPGALVGNNHHAAPFPGEDFQIFERDPPGANSAGFNRAAPEPNLAWESCETLNRSWGYNARDRSYKSAGDVVRLLARSAGRGSNLLLNVGPGPDGTIPAESAERLAEVGRWLSTRGPSVFGTRRGPVAPTDWGVSTESARPGEPKLVYLHHLDPTRMLKLPASAVSFDARLLGSVKPLTMQQAHGEVVIEIPEADRDPFDTVVVLTPRILDRLPSAPPLSTNTEEPRPSPLPSRDPREVDWVSAGMAAVTSFALVSAGWVWLNNQRRGEGEPPAVGKRPPVLRLLDAGTSAPLPPGQVGPRGKLVWVTFWSAAGDEGRADLTGLDSVWRRLRSRSRFAMAVAAVETDRPELVRKALDASGATVPVYLATPETLRSFGAEPGSTLPLHVLLDEEGKVATLARGGGEAQLDRLAGMAERWLDELDPLGRFRFAGGFPASAAVLAQGFERP